MTLGLDESSVCVFYGSPSVSVIVLIRQKTLFSTHHLPLSFSQLYPLLGPDLVRSIDERGEDLDVVDFTQCM